MLSLNDYVNVACLLEFAISITLVPTMEYPHLYQLQLNPYKNVSNTGGSAEAIKVTKVTSHTTTMAQRRIQALPKPLAGRISKSAITWGSEYASRMHASLHESINNLASSQNNTTEDIMMAQQSYDVYNTYQSYIEVTLLATSIGHLVLLDRFRPMLLPRHLSDIYLATIIAERLRWVLLGLEKTSLKLQSKQLPSWCIGRREREIEKLTSCKLQTLERALLFVSLKFPSTFITRVSSNEIAPTMTRRSIDHREAALACRTLLSGGAIMNPIEQTSNPSIPPWLRMRLGQLLTSLAENNLHSVVDVFVAYARGHGGNNADEGHNGNSSNVNDEMMTGAAARLAHALCAKPATTAAVGQSSTENCSSPFLEKLCDQFVDFLVEEGQLHIQKSKEADNYELIRSRSSVAMSLTLWATIGQLSMDTFLRIFVPKLTAGLFPAESSSGRPKYDAIQSTAAIGALLSTAPSSLDPSTKTKMRKLLISSISQLSDKTAKCNLLGQILRLATFFSKEDSVCTESKLVVPLDDCKEKNDDVSLRNVAVMTIIQILQVLTRVGLEAQDAYDICSLALLKAVSVNALDKDGYSYNRESFAEEGGKLHPLCYFVKQDDVDRGIDHLMKEIETRARLLVQQVVVSLSGTIDEDMFGKTKDTDMWMRTFPSNLFRLVLKQHFAASTNGNVLPMHAPIDDDKEGINVASTALLALLCEECSPTLLIGGDSEAECGTLRTLGLIIDSAASLLGEESGVDSHGSSDYTEEVLSTASIVLSLLVAILELGAKKRSGSGERILQSMLPSLRALACCNTQSTNLSEMAEMASHAMALVAARNDVEYVAQTSGPTPTATADNKTDIELIADHICKAEQDLESSQPPLRARGVVSLRHIARALADSGSSHVPKKSLVTEVVDSVKTSDGNNEQFAVLARTLARLCLNALADSESYVYLASIHTLVAISDICPSEIIPLMALVVSAGSLKIIVLTDSAKEASVEMSLTEEQRIKAVEALIFIIRRRGDGIFLNGRTLLENMLFGQMVMSTHDNDGAPLDLSQIMQSKTHDYFQQSQDNDDGDDTRMRLGTGGPVFSCEESDLLRSAIMSLICELVSALHPAQIARYCHALVRLALDVLHLESSRPVRRSAAMLARELYACVMREETEQEGQGGATSTMAIAMVRAGEDKLFNALTRCVAAADVDTNDSLAVKGKTRLLDPATQTRSKEAVELREDLEVIFQMAVVVAQSLEREANDPVVEVVRKALSESM